MTERVQRLVDFFKKNKHYVPGCGIFSCRGTFRDSMHTIYDEPSDGVIVDMCYDYDYIECEMAALTAVAGKAGICCKVIFETCYLTEEEIIGLTDEEFQEAGKAIYEMYVSPWERENEDDESECSGFMKTHIVRVREDDGHIVDIATFFSREEAERCAKCVESDFGIRNLYIVDDTVYDKFDMLDVDQFTDIKTRIDSINQ